MSRRGDLSRSADRGRECKLAPEKRVVAGGGLTIMSTLKMPRQDRAQDIAVVSARPVVSVVGLGKGRLRPRRSAAGHIPGDL